MDDFYCTAIRMHSDVKILFATNESYFNTCYLLECYGKLLIKAYNPIELVKDYGHDLKDINKKINNEISLNTIYAKYCLDLKVECQTIVCGHSKWDPIKRYNDNSSQWNQKAIADIYINESSKIINLINEMKLDGVI